ncbi:L,D-transpeptidase [Thermophilibacter sp. ZX-H3]|uniref:L,D-transpeptidase n=1 Tax=unclassified Thermophilibacter TaxID=2847308 RepID=UPI004040831C
MPQQEDGPSLGEDVPGQVDDEPVDTEDAVGSVPSTGDKEIAPVVPNEVLSSADGAEAQAPESVAADLPQASLPEIGWEGDSYWDGTVNEDGTAKAYTGWVVDDHEGKGLQRYWVENGEKVTNRVFEIGDGTFGYALSSWVLRGVSDVIDGLVYVANNDGVLLSAGWHVGDYGQGLQRYWIDAGEHAAVVGYDDGSEGAGNWAHYTTSGGYVLRGGADLSSSSPEDDGMFYADNDGRLHTSGWLVTSAFGQGLQRYWFEGGKVASVGVHKTGASSWTYTTSNGYVLRGYLPVGGLVYLADNDGNLAGGAAGGWVVSDDFGQGLQRYWIDAGEHAAVVGYDDGSEGAGNWAHYTTSGGYVLRGGADLSSSSPEDDGMFYADNDGRLHTSGWLVTSAFGQGLQRYWFEGGKVASVGVHKTGASSWTYTTSNGYVLRGYLPVGGLVYLADNDGNLAGGAAGGWVVSDDFGQGLQRYWIDAGEHAAVVGFSNDGWAHYTTSNGYVLRGKMKTSNGFLLADDNGCLAEGKYAAGMVVTDAFEGSLERYYLVKASDGHLYTKSGHIEYGGRHYYGSPDTGQILRGKLRYGNGMLLADNDGVLAWTEGWLVTDIYDGVLQRYRIDTAPGDGLMGARIGFFTLGGNDYYGREDEGYVVIGLYIAPSGKAYYGDNDGVLTTIPLSQVAINLWNRIKNVSSATQYLIAVDCENCHTVVFQGSAGNWTPIFDWLCGVGLPQYNNGQGTIRGEWTIGGNNSYCNWTDDPDFSEWGDPYTWQTTYFAKDDIKWYTNFCLDLGFHSTIGWDGGYSDPNQIGKKISHGCIRLLEENAKWIYYNAGYGTKVVTV